MNKILAGTVVVTMLLILFLFGRQGVVLSEQVWPIEAPEYADPTIYDFEDEYIKNISLYVYDTYEELNEVREAYGVELGLESNWVTGFSVREGEKCSVFIVKPDDWNDKERLQSLGHEVLHCFEAKHKGEVIG